MQKRSRASMNIYQFDRIRCCTTSIDRIQLLRMSKSEFTAVPKQKSQQQQLKNCVCCCDVMDKNKFNKLSAASLFVAAQSWNFLEDFSTRKVITITGECIYKKIRPRANLMQISNVSVFSFHFQPENECRAQSSFSLKYACSTDRVVISQN